MPPRSRTRRRRSNADTAESTNVNIQEQLAVIRNAFGSETHCKNLYNYWKNGSRADDEAKQGHAAWNKLSKLRSKHNRLVQEEETAAARLVHEEEERRRREEEERNRAEEAARLDREEEEWNARHAKEVEDCRREEEESVSMEEEECSILHTQEVEDCHRDEEESVSMEEIDQLVEAIERLDRDSSLTHEDVVMDEPSPSCNVASGEDEGMEEDDVSHQVRCDTCQNCRRKQYTNDEFFRIEFIRVQTNKISNAFYKNKNIQTRLNETSAEPLDLCIECWNHLRNPKFDEKGESRPPLDTEEDNDTAADEASVSNEASVTTVQGRGRRGRRRRRKGYKRDRSQNDFINTVYAFLWDLLSGSHKSGTFEDYYFVQVYGGEILWQMIPLTMRRWWIDAIKEINVDGVFHYSSCTLEYPPCVFEDKTVDFVQFELDVARSLPSMADALNRTGITNQNVLCPFGCSESCRNCHPIRWDLMIQFILKKVILNLPLEVMKKYRYYMASSENYYREDDNYFCFLMNSHWKVKPAVIQTKRHGWAALSCARHKGLGDKHRLYPPNNPHNFNVNASNTDQIGPVQLRPRVAQQTRKSGYGCGSIMMTQTFNFKGVDTFDVSQDGYFRTLSHLQERHSAAALAGRHDIRSYLSHMGESNDIEPQMVQDLLSFSTSLYPHGIDKSLTDGATYVPFEVAMKYHLSLKQESVISYRYTNSGGITVNKSIRRAWPRFINTIQKQDSSGFGYQFRPIPPIKVKNSLVTWILFSLLGSSSELWCLIDSMRYFEKNQWQGHTLTNIGHYCFQNDSVTVSSKSPFKKVSKIVDLVSTINNCIGVEQSMSVDNLSDELLCHVFSAHHDNVKVFGFSPDEEPVVDLAEDTKFLLFVTQDVVSDDIIVDDIKFEHRVMCCMKRKGTGQDFESVRFMRHGGQYSSYWQQHRDDWNTNKCLHASDLKMYAFSDEWKFVSLFVREESGVTMDRFRLDFLKSLGGQVDVLCQKCQFPLIPSHAPKEMKSRCNAWKGPPSQYQQCNRKESYVCCTPGCNLRCCLQCFRENSTAGQTMLFPHDDIDDGTTQAAAETTVDDECDDDDDDRIDVFADAGEEVDAFESNVMTETDMNDALIEGQSRDGGVLDHTCPHLVYSVQEGEFESSDDINLDDTVPTTNAGLFPSRVFQRENAGRVNGHVLLNQVGGTLHRHNSRVTGTQREQYFVQRLCSTRGGQSLSLMYPESSIFIRHYYSSSSDLLSPLGALPLWLFRGGNALGFASIEDHLRARITDQSSTISTDPHYTSYAYDVMMNQALGKSDSRLLSHRGLRVSENGKQLSPREEDSNDDILGDSAGMKGDVDGHTNVRNLCASMKYVKWSHFYTITLNHKDHPGIKDLFEWMNKEEWLEKHPDYPIMSDANKREFIRGFNNAYVQMVTPKWIDITEVIINKITNTLTHIGASSAVFARHEYQEAVGNPSHIHMIVAVEESSMGNASVQEYLNDLIAGHFLEVVRPEDIHDWLSEGFLVDEYDINALTTLAKTILSHTCNHRCQRRVNSKGDEKDTKCRKLHSVKDTPDPTQDCFVEIDYDWSETTKDLLHKIGLFNKENETYGHSWFTPTRHMTACQSNATDNMSPVDRKLFAVLRSMQNLQFLLATNGVCKYVVKYLVKIDEVNRVTMFVNSKTGAIEASKELLNNTKIASSSKHEKAWHEKQRHKKHPNGVEIAVTQMIHKILLRDEVITNLTFVDICTQPFEVRPATQHELKKRKEKENADRQDESVRADEGAGQDDSVPLERADERVGQDDSVPTESAREGLDDVYHITVGQKLIFGEKLTNRYDKVSEFGLREPRLLKVANTLEAYFRFFHIDKTIQSDDRISFCNDQVKDRWFDCLKRWTRIRKSALGELAAHIQSNLEEYIDDLSAITMNNTILSFVQLAMTDDSSL